MPDRPPSPALPVDDSLLPPPNPPHAPAQRLYSESSPVYLPERYWHAHTSPAAAHDDGLASDLTSRMGAVQVDDDGDPSSAKYQIPEYPTPAMLRRERQMGRAKVYRAARQRRSSTRQKDHSGNKVPDPESGVGIEAEMDCGRGAGIGSGELEWRRRVKQRKREEQRQKRDEMHRRAAEGGKVLVPPPSHHNHTLRTNDVPKETCFHGLAGHLYPSI